MHKFLKIYFWNENLHVSDSSSVHHQEFSTVHTAVVYVIQLASCQQTCIIYIIAVCTVKKYDGQRNSPKHVEFHSKINLRN